jgi:microcystin-dependent protein
MTKRIIMLMYVSLFGLLNNSYGQKKLNDNLGNSTAAKELNVNNYQLLNLSALSIGGGEVTNENVGIDIKAGKTLVIPTVNNLLGTTSSIPASQTLNGMVVYDLQTQSIYIRQNGSWSKFAPQNLSSSKVLIGDLNNNPAQIELNGDAVLNNLGVMTITNNTITSAKIINGTIDTINILNQSIHPANIKTSGIAGQVLTTSGTPLAATWVSKTIPFIIGQIKFSAQSADHDGWIICNGRSLSRTTYAALFSVLNNTFGTSTATTFLIPNLTGRYMGGIGTGSGLTARTAGLAVGAETIALTTTNLPSHNHTSGGTDIDGNHTHYYVSLPVDGQGGTTIGKPGSGTPQKAMDAKGLHAHILTTPSQGAGAPFNIFQPTLFVGNCFIYSGVR